MSGALGASEADFRCRGYGRFSQFQLTKLQSEGLKTHIQIHSKSIGHNHVPQEIYACKNSKPQGLEDSLKRELLTTERRVIVSPFGYGMIGTTVACTAAYVG